ncbi:MAG TPA: hypothetical protein VNW06_11665 [Cytophagaceae bacterium]|jgi:hypothetical protein|nr:hypothetical protein [Cytophagaceae bacterium]
MRGLLFILLLTISVLPGFSQSYQKLMDGVEYKNRVHIHCPTYQAVTYVYDGDKVIRVRDDLFYYWFAASDVKKTQGGYDGKLINGEYAAFYLNKNLKEKGNFRYGLKVGIWKSWYISGRYSEIANWKKGELNGHYSSYDSSGYKKEEGNYKKGKKDGVIKLYDSDGGVEKITYKEGVEEKVKHEKRIKKIVNVIPGLKKKKEKSEQPAVTTPDTKSDKKESRKSKKDKPKIKVKKFIKVVPLPENKKT